MNRASILIEADELQAKINDPNLRIYDATILFFGNDGDATAYDAYLNAHIPNAGFFDHDAFSDASNKYMYMVPPEAALAQQIGNIGIAADNDIVFYTSEILSCATRAWWLLRYAGHNNVRVLNGGLKAWQAIGGQIENGGHTYAKTSFECQLRPDMFVGKDDVLAVMNDAAVNTEYSLSIGAYGNTTIEGSSCLPMTQLMHGNDALLSNNELKAQLQHSSQFNRVITYCGGGIAATTSAIAHLIAGNENVSVYDGSLSEWMGEGLPTEQAT